MRGISPRRVQKYRADTAVVIAKAAPNSVVYQRVEPVLRIKLSKTPGTKTLWLAWNTAAGQTLSDFSLSHASMKLAETITTVEQQRAYQRFEI